MGKSKLVNRASGLGSLIMGEPGDLKTSNVEFKILFYYFTWGGGGFSPLTLLPFVDYCPMDSHITHMKKSREKL